MVGWVISFVTITTIHGNDGEKKKTSSFSPHPNLSGYPGKNFFFFFFALSSTHHIMLIYNVLELNLDIHHCWDCTTKCVMWICTREMGNSNNCKGLNNFLLKLRCILLHSLQNCSIFTVFLILISSHILVWFDVWRLKTYCAQIYFFKV